MHMTKLVTLISTLWPSNSLILVTVMTIVDSTDINIISWDCPYYIFTFLLFFTLFSMDKGTRGPLEIPLYIP